MGQRMKQSQASWQPLPLTAWPLQSAPLPSAAAYPLPQKLKHAAPAVSAEPHQPALQQRQLQQMAQGTVQV